MYYIIKMMKRSKIINTVKEIKIDVIDNKKLLNILRKSEIFSDLVLYMERKINNTDKNIVIEEVDTMLYWLYYINKRYLIEDDLLENMDNFMRRYSLTDSKNYITIL